MSGVTLSIREILGKLISYDTTAHQDNLSLISWVEDYLDSWSVPHFRVDYEAGRKTNLFATIGPAVSGGIVLSGHTDVVPTDGQSWHSDPFLMDERDGKYFGRGACDMKGFLAVALAMVPRFVAAGLKEPIHLALSCDEEVGCKGVRPLISHLRDHLPKPRAVIVGEPTSMRVVNAHKSVVSFSTEVTGHEAHSSCTHLGVNAIFVAAELLTELHRLASEFRGRADAWSGFDPPYSTLHVGMIAGGIAKNIIPRHCGFRWETRLLPGADPDEAPERLKVLATALEPGMRAVSPECGIVTERTNFVPGLQPQSDSTAERLALHLAEANRVHAVSYGTEAGLFQEMGIPTVVCGPGSIEQAHKPDEYVEIAQLMKCETFMQRLVALCSTEPLNSKPEHPN